LSDLVRHLDSLLVSRNQVYPLVVAALASALMASDEGGRLHLRSWVLLVLRHLHVRRHRHALRRRLGTLSSVHDGLPAGSSIHLLWIVVLLPFVRLLRVRHASAARVGLMLVDIHLRSSIWPVLHLLLLLHKHLALGVWDMGHHSCSRVAEGCPASHWSKRALVETSA